jgi:microcompartment protein CcmL/EutN
MENGNGAAESGRRAAGLIEVYGFAAALAAMDAACKAADVTVQAIDKNKPANAETLPVPLLVMVKLRGGLADIVAAVNAGTEAASKISGVVASHIIPLPYPDTEKMLSINEIK